jgi:hypothetical protein
LFGDASEYSGPSVLEFERRLAFLIGKTGTIGTVPLELFPQPAHGTKTESRGGSGFAPVPGVGLGPPDPGRRETLFYHAAEDDPGEDGSPPFSPDGAGEGGGRLAAGAWSLAPFTIRSLRGAGNATLGGTARESRRGRITKPVRGFGLPGHTKAPDDAGWVVERGRSW